MHCNKVLQLPGTVITNYQAVDEAKEECEKLGEGCKGIKCNKNEQKCLVKSNIGKTSVSKKSISYKYTNGSLKLWRDDRSV